MGYTKGSISSKDRELPLFLRICGTDFAQHRIRRPEGMPFWQLFYGVEGIGEFRFADKTYRLLPGQTALLFPNVSHSYSPISGKWQVHFLGFEGNACLKLLHTMGFTESAVYHQENPALCVRHILAIEKLFLSGQPDAQKECSKEIYSLLLDLSTDHVSFFVSPEDDRSGLVQDVLHYLETHYMEDVSLPVLAEIFHLTPEYLCSVFKEAAGDTIIRYLTKIRIHHARILLVENPDLTLQDIASRCGFHSPSYFGKVFRRHVGMTPQAFRMS